MRQWIEKLIVVGIITSWYNNTLFLYVLFYSYDRKIYLFFDFAVTTMIVNRLNVTFVATKHQEKAITTAIS